MACGNRYHVETVRAVHGRVLQTSTVGSRSARSRREADIARLFQAGDRFSLLSFSLLSFSLLGLSLLGFSLLGFSLLGFSLLGFSLRRNPLAAFSVPLECVAG